MATFDDSDEEETYIKLGNPLPQLDDDAGRKKPVSMQDIQARDSKGRPRFHGAFTGGFSAGYFNTVGSKEGWTPSTFVSSRTKKAESELVQRPENFMDEEDFSEHGIAPRKLVTAGQFTSEERKRRRLDEAKAETQDAAIPGVPALVDLIVPERLSIGVKLLRKMGWKEGQGVGPRLSRKQRKLQKSGKKIYGCALPPSSSEEEDDLDDSSVLKDITFAPRGITPIHLLAKDNTHGLGYRGLNPQSALPSTHINLFEPPAITKTGRKGIKGQAFGVGALEDDDDDIYSTDHISNYDVTMGDEEDNNFGWTAPKGRGQTETPVGYVGKMLSGFKLSSTPLVQKKHFPPPPLPRNFRPVHVFKKPDEENLSALVPHPTARGVPQFMKPDEKENQSTMGAPGSSKGNSQYADAMSRGIALGEQPFVGTVFDLISKEDKKKMEEAKQTSTMPNSEQTQSTQSNIVKQSLDQSRINSASTLTSKEPVQTVKSQGPVRSHSSQEPVYTSVEEQRRSGVPLFQGGAGFKPFTRDPDKQERYEKYLTLVKQGHKDPYSAVIMPGQTEWETEREREEFARAAKLYKPLAGMMAMRFTSGKQQDDTSQVDVKVEESIDKCDATKAAEIKMYGKLTRDVLEWHPDRLLCKRFNIPDPYPGSSIVGLATVKRDKFSVFNFLSFPSQPETSQTELPALAESSGMSASASETVSQENSEKTESKVDKELNKSKNMKSIFSHLVETENQNQKITKGLSFSVKSVNPNKPKEFKSIFSHLEDSDYKPIQKLVPMETDEPQSGTSNIESASKQEEPDKAGTTTSKIEPQAQLEDEETPELDLFRAIFKNTDSEDSSSSVEDVEDDKMTANDDKEKDSMITGRTDSSTHGKDRLKDSLETDSVRQQPHPLANLPGNGEAIPTLGQRPHPPASLPGNGEAIPTLGQRPHPPASLPGNGEAIPTLGQRPHPPASLPGNGEAIPTLGQRPHPPASLPGNGEAIPTLGQRLSPQQEESDDEYGPALPPALPATKNTEKYPHIPTKASFHGSYVDLTQTSSSSKKHKHHKHKSKKDKKEKHKKSKHKKKDKKKEKKKKERREKSSSDTDHTSDKDTESEDSSSEVPSDRDILHKMKSLRPGQRLRAIDFM